MYVYDTSALIEVLELTPKGQEIIKALGNTIVRTTSITIHEILSGAQDQLDYKKLQVLLKTFTVFNFNFEDAEISSLIEKELATEKKKINDADLFIAAICIKNKSTLVTCDKDFKKIKELNLELF